ncbi:MAG: hypothetical protein ABI129_03380, partial [Rhodanobacter sp.]
HHVALRHHHGAAVADQGERFTAQTETTHANVNPELADTTTRPAQIAYYAARSAQAPVSDQAGAIELKSCALRKMLRSTL